MEFKGTVIHDENKEFGIALVNYSDFRDTVSKQKTLKTCLPFFNGLPVILACEDEEGIPLYYGDQHLVQTISHLKPSSIEWKSYTA